MREVEVFRFPAGPQCAGQVRTREVEAFLILKLSKFVSLLRQFKIMLAVLGASGRPPHADAGDTVTEATGPGSVQVTVTSAEPDSPESAV